MVLLILGSLTFLGWQTGVIRVNTDGKDVVVRIVNPGDWDPELYPDWTNQNSTLPVDVTIDIIDRDIGRHLETIVLLANSEIIMTQFVFPEHVTLTADISLPIGAERDIRHGLGTYIPYSSTFPIYATISFGNTTIEIGGRYLSHGNLHPAYRLFTF
jgi:hypothetical protein